uniref:Uncharacterized protein n=1 Tax=Ditylenchus dipsaci TaxID=166011 RepID=A0A915ESW8_9BILA
MHGLSHCEFQQAILEKEGKKTIAFTTFNNNNVPLRAFYDKVDSLLDSSDFFDSLYNSSQSFRALGCDDTFMKNEPNICLVQSERKLIADKSELLYRLHCCCEDPSKCNKQQKNTREVICPYDVRNYTLFDRDHIVPVEMLYNQTMSVDEVNFADTNSEKSELGKLPDL